jgi:hypothetical protein
MKSDSLFAHTKSLAVEMNCHPRTVKRWWKKLNVPPDVIGHGINRWYLRNARKLIARWKKYRATHRHAASWRNGLASSA